MKVQSELLKDTDYFVGLEIRNMPLSVLKSKLTGHGKTYKREMGIISRYYHTTNFSGYSYYKNMCNF